MKEQVKNKANAFRGVNELAMKGEIVVYGSTYMANFPFYELINKSRLENAVYNRSIAEMTIDEALQLLQVCVLDIKPGKVFIHLGEADFDRPDAVEKYTEIVRRIHAELPDTKVYLITVQDKKAQKFNERILELSNRKNICGIRFSVSDSYDYKGRFKELSCYFRSKPLTFTDAFAVAGL